MLYIEQNPLKAKIVQELEACPLSINEAILTELFCLLKDKIFLQPAKP
jgi:hypothetical protein